MKGLPSDPPAEKGKGIVKDEARAEDGFPDNRSPLKKGRLGFLKVFLAKVDKKKKDIPGGVGVKAGFDQQQGCGQ